jgi:DNA repair exonuclease SbcCD ATPase subunit
MIKSLSMKCFRKHIDTQLTFTAGLNVLRGPNEIGKTTVTEALLYALYGSKSLRNPLVDTVTWGRKESELKVELVISISGIDYVFKRSKAGAECVYGDGLVTGQSEVSAFATKLLGADSKTAGLLMLASQNGLRGALDDGPAAVSTLMGKLADFDMIDKLLESAQANLSLGSDAPVRVKLSLAEEAHAAAAAAIVPLDPQAQEKIDALTAQHKVQQTVSKKASVAREAAEKALDEAEAGAATRTTCVDQLAKAKEQLSAELVKLEAASVDAAKVPDQGRISSLRYQVATNSLEAYSQFQKLPPQPDVFWDEPRESFDAALREAVAASDEARAVQEDLIRERTRLGLTKITDGKCPTCGTAKNSAEHVAEHNATVDLQIRDLMVRQDLAAKSVVQASKIVADLKAIDKVGRDSYAAACNIAPFIDFDMSVYPALVKWKGDVPSASLIAEQKAELKLLEEMQTKAVQAQGRVEAHTATAKDLQFAVQEWSETLEKNPPVDLQPFNAAYDQAYVLSIEADSVLSSLTLALAEATAQKVEAERVHAQAVAAAATASARVKEHQDDIKALAFNNGLVKKLKGLKPAITDYLWNATLAAVSNFFSSLRGETSVVAKDESGFKVNGQSIESLSGSTLDVLALAIRVALSKTFVPHASFLVLDEPAHGCDSTRTGNVLGFLSSVGFEQTLLASHDELSESVADHVIQLGE